MLFAVEGLDIPYHGYKIKQIGVRGFMILFVTLLGINGMMTYGLGATLPQMWIAVITALVVDGAWHFYDRKELYISKTAIISALIISVVLDLNQPWYVPCVAAAIAMLGKNIIRVSERHIFNPAAFGLAMSVLIFPNAMHVWWAESSLLLVSLFGLFIVFRLRKFDLVISYLLTFAAMVAINLLLSGHGLLGHGAVDHNILSHVFRETSAILSVFFLLFMLIEPMTSPIGSRSRIIYGAIAALFTYVCFNFIPFSFIQNDALLYGLMVANLATAFPVQRWFLLIIGVFLGVLPAFATVSTIVPESLHRPQAVVQNVPVVRQGVKEFRMTAKQFEFIPSVLRVRKGDQVSLHITSIDVKHGFSLKAFNIRKTLTPGKTVDVDFVADKTGEFPFVCSVYCGSGHQDMHGMLIVE